LISDLLQTMPPPQSQVASSVSGEEPPAMLTVKDVAALLACSPRHVCRLVEAGRLPRPVKLGALVRWPRAAMESWVAAGCPLCSDGGPR